VTDHDEVLPGHAEAALVACLLVTAGSSVGGRLTLLVGVPLTLAGLMAAWIAARRTQSAATARSFSWVYFWLSANGAIALSVGPQYPAPVAYEIAYRAHPALGLVLIGIVAAGSQRARRRATWTAVASATALLIATPIAMPAPTIDVWAVTQTSVLALLHGIHPYTVTAPDINRGLYDFGYTTTAYPYMPLDLLVNVPAVALLGDYRFGLALCFPITIALLRAAGRRLAVAEHTIDVLTLTLALQPHAAFIVAAGWIEPMMVATLAAFVYLSVDETGGTGAAIAFLLLPALKQYVVAPVLMFLAMRPRPRPRAVAAGVLVAAATVVPFLVWNPQPTIAGMTAILTNMRAQAAFRTDSDSLTAFAAMLVEWRAGPWLGALAQLCAGAVAFAMLRRDRLAGLLLASGLALLTSFLLGTQAFVNYYSFAAALLLFAALAFARRDAEAR
jgi:hypothetical protein